MTEATKALPNVEIEFLGEKKKLVFSMAAFCRLEEMTGKNALDGETWSKPDARLLTTMLWAALSTNDKELTIDNVRENLTMEDLMKAYKAIIEAFKRASPSEEKKSENDQATEKQNQPIG